MKILVIGAGVAGLAIGWRLAQAGHAVEVLERGQAGQGATWASAGMIAATAEMAADDDPHALFARTANALWPDFAREIEAASGHGIGFRQDGALMAALDGAQARKLSDMAKKLSAKNMPGAWLTPEQARAKEPMLAPALHGALEAPADAHVDNRALGAALAEALRRAAGKLRELCPVSSLVTNDGRASGVLTEQGALHADAVIVAAGAWCGGLSNEALPPVRPVKGQMLALEPPPGATLPRRPLWGSDVYLVPRRDRLLVGATLEEAGFDSAVTAEAREWLLANARRLMPSLETWRVVESWAGLRPATPDGLPVLGATALPGLFVAGGQFRNGILFAPAVADALGRLVLGETAGPALRAFDPRRFRRHMDRGLLRGSIPIND